MVSMQVVKDFYQSIRRRPLISITLAVLLAHFLLFYWLSDESPRKPTPQRSRKENVVVNTVSLTPKTTATPDTTLVAAVETPVDVIEKPVKPVGDKPKPAPTPVKKHTAVKHEEVKPQPTPPPVKKSTTFKLTPKQLPGKKTPKKGKTPPSPKSPPAPKSPPPPKSPTTDTKKKLDSGIEAAKEKQKSLLLKAQASISKVSNDQALIAATMPKLGKLPNSINSLQSDMIKFDNSDALSAKELSYREELAGRLRLSLRLPEYGAVKIKLTLKREGSVVSLSVVSSESQANKKYIEKIVPSLTFPEFGNNFDKQSQFTFQITLNNDV